MIKLVFKSIEIQYILVLAIIMVDSMVKVNSDNKFKDYSRVVTILGVITLVLMLLSLMHNNLITNVRLRSKQQYKNCWSFVNMCICKRGRNNENNGC